MMKIIRYDNDMQYVRQRLKLAAFYLKLANKQIKKACFRSHDVHHAHSLHDNTLLKNIDSDCVTAMRKCSTMIDHFSAQANILLDTEYEQQEHQQIADQWTEIGKLKKKGGET